MAASVPKRPPTDSGVLKGAVGAFWVAVLLVIFAALSVLLFYVTITYWPPTAPADGQAGDSTINFLGNTFTISRDKQLLITVALMGSLGAMVHVMRSFFKYVGERSLVWSWVASYFLIPFVGAGIALIMYVVLRAGLLGGVDGSEGNIWGFAAIAALTGMFSAQAASKLKTVFETILAPEKPGSESIKDAPPPIAFSPTSGAVGSQVAITGGGLTGIAPVAFGGGAAGTDPAWDDAAKKLTVTVPDGATTGPLTVTVGGTDLTSTDTFTVTTP